MASFFSPFSFSLCCGCPSPFLHSFSSYYLISPHFASSSSSSSLGSRTLRTSLPLKPSSPSSNQLLCKVAEYVFPDPIPEFAESESNKFRTHLLEKLTKKKKDLFGDSIEEVVGVCTEILSNFLHTEYGGPGTLLVIPFIDMADTLNERGLPGGPQVARAAVIWAQKHVDKDWNEWNKEGKEDPK